MACSTSPGLGNPGFHPLAQDLAFKLGTDRQQPSHSPPHRRGQIQGFAEGDKTYAEELEFLERADEVREGAPPAIQAPDDDGIDGPSACRLHEDLALPALMRTRTDLLNGEDNSSTALCGIGRHGVPLEREGLLFLGRDTRIQP